MIMGTFELKGFILFIGVLFVIILAAFLVIFRNTDE